MLLWTVHVLWQTSLSLFIGVVWYILSLSAVSTTCEFEEKDCCKTANITVPTSCLEIDNKLEMKMKFRSTVTNTFVAQLENITQFLRDTAIVTIVQGMSVTKYRKTESWWILYVGKYWGGGGGGGCFLC